MVTNNITKTNKKSRSLWVLSVLVVLTLQIDVAMGQVWNSGADFHVSAPQDPNNPTNDWLYGFKIEDPNGGQDGITSPLTLFSHVDATIPYSYWADWDGIDPYCAGYVHQNRGDAVLEQFGAHWEPWQTTLWPGENDGTLPCFRWIAPADGLYSLDVMLTGNKLAGQYSFWLRTWIVSNIGGTSTVLDQGYLYDGYYYSGAVEGSYVEYSGFMSLSAGDSIDFLVDDGDSGTGAGVGLDATITQIPSPLLLLSADNGVESGAFGVTGWQDQSGNGNDAVTEYGQPQVATQSFPNGDFPVVRFNGDDGFDVLNDTVFESNSLSVFVVASVNAGSQDQVLVATASAAGSGYYIGIDSATANKPIFNTNGGGSVSASVELSADVPYILSAFLDEDSGGQKALNVNRIQRGSGSGSATYTNTQTMIGVLNGGTKYFTGDIAEILVFGEALSSDEINSVETYLADKYGIRTCGDPDTQFLPGDANKDCYVNLEDLSVLAKDWLDCNKPDDSSCVE